MAFILLMIIMMMAAESLPTSGLAQVKERREKKHPCQRTPKGVGVTTTRTPLKGQYLIWSTSCTASKQIDNRCHNATV